MSVTRSTFDCPSVRVGLYGLTIRLHVAVMWSETVCLRTRPVGDQKTGLGLGLAGLMLFCETRSCHIVVMIFKDTETFQVDSTIYSFSILCLEHHYCGDQQWRSLA